MFPQCRCGHLVSGRVVGAMRLYTALLRQRVRKPNARSDIAETFSAYYYGASTRFTARNGVGVGEDAAKMVFLGLIDLQTGSSETVIAPTPPMSAPGGLARRLWGTASANGMSATSARDQSHPNSMARRRTLRRATVSASAKMP